MSGPRAGPRCAAAMPAAAHRRHCVRPSGPRHATRVASAKAGRGRIIGSPHPAQQIDCGMVRSTAPAVFSNQALRCYRACEEHRTRRMSGPGDLNDRFASSRKTGTGPGHVKTSQQSLPVGTVATKICKNSGLVVCGRPGRGTNDGQVGKIFDDPRKNCVFTQARSIVANDIALVSAAGRR